MKNEALRIFLAVAALIITAMLTNPLSSTEANGFQAKRNIASENEKVAAKQQEAAVNLKAEKKAKADKSKKKVARLKIVHKANRSFAFFYRR
jgi:S-adenosylhomocysteine hydrolase